MKIMIDFDGCIVNTIAVITKLYNEDFKYYKDFQPVDWREVNTWDFEELRCASKDYINTYFNQPRFFDSLEYMPLAKLVLDVLHNAGHKIIIVSAGYSPNLKGKEKWIKKNIPYAEFIGVNLKEHKDKSHVDMSGCIFIDDSSNNLLTSNALMNICFGEVYKWNEDWQGFRVSKWLDVYKILLGKRRIR